GLRADRRERGATLCSKRVLRRFDGGLSVYPVCVLPHLDGDQSMYYIPRFAPLRPGRSGCALQTGPSGVMLRSRGCPLRQQPGNWPPSTCAAVCPSADLVLALGRLFAPARRTPGGRGLVQPDAPARTVPNACA